MSRSDFRYIIWHQRWTNFGIVIVLFLLASCATSPDWRRVKSIQPESSHQHEKEIFDVAFYADNQILLLVTKINGEPETAPEIRNYDFQKLDDVKISGELKGAPKLLGRPDDKLSYFKYHRENHIRLAHYEPGIEKDSDTRTYDLGDNAFLFERDFIFTAVPERRLLFIAPKYSNTIFEKDGEGPIKIATTERGLVASDIAYNSETNELFVASSIPDVLVRYSTTEAGIQRKDYLKLDVRPHLIFIDETSENVWILDFFSNEFEVIRTDSGLESDGVYAMPKNISLDDDWEQFDLKSPGSFNKGSSSAYHLTSLNAMIAIRGGILKIHDTRDLGQVPFRLEGARNVRRFAVSSDQRYLLLLSNRGDLLLYNLSELYQ